MSLPLNMSLAERMASLPKAERDALLAEMPASTLEALTWDFDFWARPSQQPPPGMWRYWLISSGRGFGKNYAAVGWVRKVHKIYPRMALIARTTNDAREVMLEGESGILKLTPPDDRPIYNPTKKRLTWPNGAVASVFSSDEPEALRGPQSYAFWADELCAWKYPKECWDNLMFGFRLGQNPRGLITTTPKPISLYKKLLKDASCHVTRGSTYENIANLSPAYIETIIKPYEGTRLGKQELHGELVEDTAGALWQAARIHELRVDEAPELVRVVVAIDPQTTADGEDSGATGIVVAGRGVDGHGYVLADLTLKGSPDAWARAAVIAYHRYKADRIVAEVNQGGDMVEHTIRTVEPDVPFRKVHAKRGKYLRAEPVAALYEQGKCHHIGVHPKLEEEQTTWIPGMKSPHRVDALTYALTDLMIETTPLITPQFDSRFGRRASLWRV